MYQTTAKLAGVLALLLVFVTFAPTQQSAPADEKAKSAAPKEQGKGTADLNLGSIGFYPPAKALVEKPTVPSLEEMLTLAVRDNPDVRVAEAKAREAEAELSRARLLVMQKVIEVHAALESQKAQVQAVEAHLARTKELVKKGFAPQTEVDHATQRLIAANAKLAEVNMQTNYLLGKNPLESKAKSPESAIDGRVQWLATQNLNASWNQPFAPYNILAGQNLNAFDPSQNTFWLAAQQPPNTWSVAATVKGTTAERIRISLDTPVKVDYKDKLFADILKDIQSKIPGVSFLKVGLVDERIIKSPPTISLQLSEEVPLGAAMQALEDVARIRFAVREYGILVTAGTSLPAGAIPLHDFWKSGAAMEKEKQPSTGAAKNPPAQQVEGVVKAVDDKTGLLTISVGSDAGLVKGNTLELFRTQPNPKYLGIIQVLEVKASEAIAKPTNSLKDGAKAGDHVASRFAGR